MATTTRTAAAAERAATAAIPSTWHLQIGWQYRAACKGPQSELFFAPNHLERKEDRHQREAEAKSICRACPVLVQCRECADGPRAARYLGWPERIRAPPVALPPRRLKSLPRVPVLWRQLAVLRRRYGSLCGRVQSGPPRGPAMTTWEYATVPLLPHNTKQILDNWGQDG
ncbi:MAG TPA: WhiB family transcriptional regulator, partial [Actinomycetota bacterium]